MSDVIHYRDIWLLVRVYAYILHKTSENCRVDCYVNMILEIYMHVMNL